MKRVKPEGVCFTTGEFNTKMSELFEEFSPDVKAKLEGIKAAKQKSKESFNKPKPQFGRSYRKLIV